MKAEDGTQSVGEDEAETGLPGFRTWNRVYVFVIAAFCVWLAALTLLPYVFP